MLSTKATSMAAKPPGGRNSDGISLQETTYLCLFLWLLNCHIGIGASSRGKDQVPSTSTSQGLRNAVYTTTKTGKPDSA